jgi:hypothetical protein
VRQAAPGEGAVLAVLQWGGLLLYCTQRGGVHAWDLRADRNAWSLPCTPNQATLPCPVHPPMQLHALNAFLCLLC